MPDSAPDEAAARGAGLGDTETVLARLRGVVGLAPRADPRRPDESGATLQIHSALLAGVSAGFAATDDLNDVLQSAARATRDALGYYSVNVFLLEEGASVSDPQAVLRVVASAGASAVLDRDGTYVQPVTVGLIGRAAREDEVVLANVVPIAGYHERPGTEHVASEMCVPIRVDRTVIGVLNLESDRRHAFTQHDVRTASILADQMAVAVSRWRLQRDRAARAAEIERLQSFNENIVQGIREGIVVADSSGLITFANRRFEQMLGYPPGELVGAAWLSLVPPAWRDGLGTQAGRGQPWGGEARLLTRQGTQIAVQVAGQRGTASAPSDGSILLFTDITHRVRAERVARALGEAGMSLQTAESESALREALADESLRSGLHVAVLAAGERDRTLEVELVSLSPRRQRALERLAGRPLQGMELPSANRLLEPRGREPRFIADPRELVRCVVPVPRDAARIARIAGLGPTMIVPLRTQGRAAGLIAVGHPDLNEADAPTATAFAHQVATALDRARLHAETEWRARQVAVFAETAQHLAATVDMGYLADGVARQLRRVFDADAGTLWVWDVTMDRVELLRAQGHPAARARGQALDRR
jgi:PAS domain S-box-containing protein